MNKIPANRVCLMFDGQAEEAARFYAATFSDSSVGAVHRAPSGNPSGSEDDVLVVEFTVLGVPCIGVNGGPHFKHGEAFSFQIATADQQETDRYWNAIVGNGGEEKHVRLVHRQVGHLLADHPAHADRGDDKWRDGSQARLRCDAADEKDRCGRHRRRPARLSPAKRE